MGEKRGMKALEAWCKRVTDGYQGVKIDNMTTSWRDGLAFCAIIHHFRPDLIDFDNLEKDDIYRNNELAFRTAENHLGIPALLDAEDMVEYEVPDRLSILTYLSQFYQTFTGSQQGSSPTRTLSKRPVSATEQGVLSPVSESPPTKVAARLGRREPCAKCGLPVFIAERLLVGGHTLYHRTCFRCARCQHQLSLANFYETEGGEYCCETCPDEVLDSTNLEEVKSHVASQNNESNLDMIGHAGLEDEYSAEFELALEGSTVSHISEDKEQPKLKFSKACSNFMSSQLASESQDRKELCSVSDNEGKFSEPQQPSLEDREENVCSLPPQFISLNGQSIDHARYSPSSTSSLNNVDKSRDKVTSESSFINIDSTTPHEGGDSEVAKYFSTKSNTSSTTGNSILFGNNVDKSKDKVTSESSFVNIDSTPPHEGGDSEVAKYSSTKSNTSNTTGDSILSGNSIPLRVSFRSLDNSVGGDKQLVGTNDSASLEENHNNEGEVPSSIVKMRLKLFEKSGDTDGNTKEIKTRSNRKYALHQKEETSSPPLDTLITGANTGATPVEPTEKIILVEEDKVETQESQDRQEKSVGENDISKEKSRSENDEIIQIVGQPLKNESQSHFDDSVEHVDTEEIMVNTTSSSISDMRELDKSDIPNDTSSFKVVEPGIIQTNLASPKNATAKRGSVHTYPKELNPFGDDDNDTEQTNGHHSSKTKVAQEVNPFGSSDSEEEMKIIVEPPTPPVPVARERKKKVLEAPKLSLNPFWSDGEEPSSGDENAGPTRNMGEKLPVPRPRTLVSVTPEPCPVPRKSLLTNSSDKFGSVSSLSSLSSAGGTSSRKKKKPAPAPPRVQDLFPEIPIAPCDNSSRASSPCPSSGYSLSPKATPRHRKSRPAPPPPSATHKSGALSFSEAKHVISRSEDLPSLSQSSEWEREKNKKDVANRNRQSETSNTINSEGPVSPNEQQLNVMPNKSTFGQWKRKKGPAPPRPVPQRRQIKVIPMKEVKRELDDIEVQQQELERQGVTLEKTIRNKFDQDPNVNDDSSMTPDVEELVFQLFELVNEKNELFRRQAELMYLRRQQRLEEEHADLEYQIRCLMDVPEHTKTDSDKAREEELIQRLVEVVERRNEIVECLEMDRIREAEEDRSIHSRLGMFSKGKILNLNEVTHSKSHGKLKKKNKKDKEKNSNKKTMKAGLDVDKDIDEREEVVPKHAKEKKSKRKWF